MYSFEARKRYAITLQRDAFCRKGQPAYSEIGVTSQTLDLRSKTLVVQRQRGGLSDQETDIQIR